MNNIYMDEAIKQAKKALNVNEMPVGAVVVYENKIIGRGYNKKEKCNDATMHAEIIAIRKACKYIKDWRLNNCSIYVTMEPCPMCMGAIREARIKNIIYGVKNNKKESYTKLSPKDMNVTQIEDIQRQEIKDIMESFFDFIRNR